jgi:hypothetical protein
MCSNLVPTTGYLSQDFFCFGSNVFESRPNNRIPESGFFFVSAAMCSNLVPTTGYLSQDILVSAAMCSNLVPTTEYLSQDFHCFLQTWSRPRALPPYHHYPSPNSLLYENCYLPLESSNKCINAWILSVTPLLYPHFFLIILFAKRLQSEVFLFLSSEGVYLQWRFTVTMHTMMIPTFTRGGDIWPRFVVIIFQRLTNSAPLIIT